MYLQSNKPFCIQGVYYISYSNPVYPCLHFITNTFDPEMIEFPFLIGITCSRVQLCGIEPLSSAFIINASCPSAMCRVYLTLTAIYPALSIESSRIEMAAGLYP